MFHRPRSTTEALELKSRLGTQGVFLAGGTDLVVGVAKGRLTVSDWIDLSGLPDLDYVREEAAELVVGPLATHAMLEGTSFSASVAEAARTVGGPAIRNRGTLAGNLGTASPAGDVNIALLAHDATVDLLSVRGQRTLKLQEFFVGPGRTQIAADEMIHAIRIPRARASGFLKIGKRRSVAISVVCAAAARLEDGRVCIALGSVAPTPFRAERAEAYLADRGLSAESIAQAARIVQEEVRPIDDHRAGADYRRAVSGVLARRLLSRIATA